MTTYQKRFRPIRRTQVKCTGKVVAGKCQCCGVYMSRTVAHNPNIEGQFGYVLEYSDGSTRQTKPFSRD
jgi:hypothetical protein